MSIDPQPHAAPTPAPAASTGPHAEPDDREEIYFEGSPSVLAVFGKLLLFVLVGLGLIVLGGFLAHKQTGPWWLWVVLILLGLMTPFIPWLQTKRVSYRITNYRIDFERGLLGKTIDTMELWHIEDLHFHQSFTDRIFNIGAIKVLAHDETLPQLELFGIPNPRPIYEMLKQRVIAVKRQRGVIKMDPG